MSDAASGGAPAAAPVDTGVQPDSPMAGVVQPQRQRFGDMGHERVQGMQRLEAPPQALGDVRPMQGVEAEIAEALGQVPQELGEVQPLEGAQVEGAPTPEQLADYQEFVDNPNIDTDKHGDKVLWYDADGKGDMRPIRLKDVPNNILMYNDYQRKTTEVSEFKRQLDRRENGQKQFTADLVAEDPNVGLRAIRTVTNEKQLEKMVLSYIKERAELETLPPSMQQRFLAQQKVEDENFYYKRRLERMEQQTQQQAAQQQQQQGAAAPDIQFVQQHIAEALPSILQRMGIPPTEYEEGSALDLELGRQFTMAAAGQRNADGTWKAAPTIQRGRAPSLQTIQQVVLAAKQNVDKMMASQYAKRIAPPKRVAPAATFSGTGPAAQPGTRGNISAPERKRWSDMDNRPRQGR